MSATQHSTIEYKIVKTLPTQDVVDLYKEGGWWEENPHSRAVIPPMIEGSFCFMVALDNGKPIGMGRVISDGYSDAYIQDVVVKKSYRGRGIGAEIIKGLTQYCVNHKLQWIALVAELNTTPFYEKCGYKGNDDDTFMILDNRSIYE
jgi:ribosomal protein S18 acetylase RimI-like enzyme